MLLDVVTVYSNGEWLFAVRMLAHADDDKHHLGVHFPTRGQAEREMGRIAEALEFAP